MSDIVKKENGAMTTAISKVALAGDLSPLSPTERVEYYRMFCEHLGLNPVTRPFDILKTGGKETLYANRSCTDQLRKINAVSIISLIGKTERDIYIVTGTAHDKAGRADAATGAVSIKGLQGDALANAMMKAETKCKRRLTLSLCGLGILDESEIETIPGAVRNVTPIATETSAVAEKKSEAPVVATEKPKIDFVDDIPWEEGKLKEDIAVLREELRLLFEDERLADAATFRGLEWLKTDEARDPKKLHERIEGMKMYFSKKEIEKAAKEAAE